MPNGKGQIRHRLDQHIPFVQQRYAIRDGLCAVQVMSYHDGCHVVFLLQLEDQLIDLTGSDGIKARGRFIEQ
jgi:hypothetical protein